jgi:MoxR-like ATPase
VSAAPEAGAVAAPGEPALAAAGARIQSVFAGRPAAVRQVLVALAAGGHVLIEDVPGTGKTTLARALARVLGGTFARIQFTPDLLPSDVVGASAWNPGTGVFEFRPGPVFAGVVLADEINRATPRTQSALLEAMGEGRVTVDGVTRDLPRPFLVAATQNPSEFEGTFPLPESQLDRFLLRLRLGYPPVEEERRVLRGEGETEAVDRLVPVLDAEGVLRIQARAKAARFDPALEDYVLRLVGETRTHPSLRLGASPRAAAQWVRAAKALAVVEGRDFATPDDLKRMAVPALAHRLVPREAGEAEGRDAREDLVRRLLESVEAPR